tara:strand:- start:34807 stop:35073 length:267 start_codon:yes stop_codon:yes gene_type:complete
MSKMEKYVDLLKNIIQHLIDSEDIEILSDFDEEDNSGQLIIKVPDSEKGRIIGKSGRTIQSLRSIFGAIGAKNSHRVFVDLEKEEEEE